MCTYKEWLLLGVLVVALIIVWFIGALSKPLCPRLYHKYVEQLNAKVHKDLTPYLHNIFTSNGTVKPPDNLPNADEFNGWDMGRVNKLGMYNFQLSLLMIGIRLWIKLGSEDVDKFKEFISFILEIPKKSPDLVMFMDDGKLSSTLLKEYLKARIQALKK